MCLSGLLSFPLCTSVLISQITHIQNVVRSTDCDLYAEPPLSTPRSAVKHLQQFCGSVTVESKLHRCEYYSAIYIIQIYIQNIACMGKVAEKEMSKFKKLF